MKLQEIIEVIESGGVPPGMAEKAAVALCEYVGGGDVYIAKVEDVARNRQIVKLWNRGVKIPEIAERTGVSTRTVRRVISASQN